MNRPSRIAVLFALAAAGCETPELMSEERMTSLGDQAWQELLATNQRVSDPQVEEFVATVARRVIAASDLRDEQVDVAVFAGDQINAFALPGCHIGVYEGLLPVAQNGAGLAAVLAHEVAHLIEDHANERMSQQLLTDLAMLGASEVFASSENREAILGALGLGAELGVALPYSREQETDADLSGIDIMAAAGYEPSEAVELWRRMRDAQQGAQPPELLSTHPGAETRIEDLGEELPEAMRIYRQASPQYGQGEPVPRV